MMSFVTTESITVSWAVFPFKVFVYDQSGLNQLLLKNNGLGSIYISDNNSMHRACPFFNTNNSLSCGSRNHHTSSFTLTSVMKRSPGRPNVLIPHTDTSSHLVMVSYGLPQARYAPCGKSGSCKPVNSYDTVALDPIAFVVQSIVLDTEVIAETLSIS